MGHECFCLRFCFLINSLGSYSGVCSYSCLQGKLRLKDLPFAWSCWKPFAFFEVSGTSADSVSFSRSSASRTVMGWKEAYLFPLIFSFEFELASQFAMSRVCLLILREPLVITSKIEMRFIHEGMELWTPFTSARQLNTEFPSCTVKSLMIFPLSWFWWRRRIWVVYLLLVFKTHKA